MLCFYVSKFFSVSEQNSLCFPCLEKVRTEFPVFPVPWPPCKWLRSLEKARLKSNEINHYKSLLGNKSRWSVIVVKGTNKRALSGILQ